jgi:peptidoglycan/LPS O-acetylase OafA/YrhL
MRIWPLYYTYILVMYGLVRNLPRLGAYQHLAAHSAYLQEHPLAIVTPLAVSLLFAQNLWVPSLFCFRDMTSITWSLCIEEQFYLFWPVAVRFLSKRAFTILLLAILIASPFLRLLVFAHGFDDGTRWQTVYRFPLFHFDAIAGGSLLAILQPKLEAQRNFKWKLCAALAVSILVLCVVGTASVWSFSAAALMSVSLIGLALLGMGKRIWEWKPLTFLGFISYGLYLIHPTIFDLLQSRTLYRMVGLNGNIKVIEVLVALFAIVLSIGIATLSRCTVEAFFLGIKDRRSRGEREKLLLLAESSGVQ